MIHWKRKSRSKRSLKISSGGQGELEAPGEETSSFPRHGRTEGHARPAMFRGNSNVYFTYLLTCLFYTTDIEPQASHGLGKHWSTELNIFSNNFGLLILRPSFTKVHKMNMNFAL